MAALAENSPLLRRELAARVRLRRIPALRFRWDPAPDHAAHMEDLIASLPDLHA
jgi:ribosome-binding factor A